MATGILVPSAISIAAGVSERLIIRSENAINLDSLKIATNGPWTPTQYSKPAVTVLTVVYPPFSLNSSQSKSTKVNYVFDAVFKILHRRQIRKTSHPVLTGANISDHAYVIPACVSLEIGMSDCMAPYSSGMWTGSSTKSVSAWQILKNLQINKTLLSLSTRLDNYVNMLIVEAQAPDTNKTFSSLRATIMLEETLSASVLSVTPSSSRSQTTDTTNKGTVQSSSPSLPQTQQFSLPSNLYPDTPTYPTVPGAGSVSSNVLSQVPF